MLARWKGGKFKTVKVMELGLGPLELGDPTIHKLHFV